MKGRLPTLLWISALVILGYVLTYALLGVAGPADRIAEAERSYLQQDDHAAIRSLELAEQDLGPGDRALRERLLQLRLAIYRRTNNYRSELEALEALAALRPDVQQTTLARIRAHLALRETEAGLALADTTCGQYPEDPRAHELRGEALQQRYQTALSELNADLRSELGEVDRERAMDHLRPWLYRGEGDPEAGSARQKFDELMQKRQPGLITSQTFLTRLLEIRRDIRAAMAAFERSLELGGQPVGAYIGLSYALEQSGRMDDLALLAEIYLSEFDHAYTVEAAIDLAELHLERGRPQATLEVARRFLPEGDWPQRAASGKLTQSIWRLLALAAEALDQLPETDSHLETSRSLRDEAEAMWNSGQVVGDPEYYRLRALLEADTSERNRWIREYDQALRNNPWASTEDQQLDAIRRQLEVAIGWRSADSVGYVNWLLDRWRVLEPASAELAITAARFRAGRGDLVRALELVREAENLGPRDEEILIESTRIIDRYFTTTGRGSADLLARALQLGRGVPDDLADPHLLMPLAERALEHGSIGMALDAANRAASVYNWARWPRQLKVEAELRTRDTRRAVEAARILVNLDPEDPQSLRLLRTALRRDGSEDPTLLYRLIQAGFADTAMGAELLGRSLDRNDPVMIEALAEQMPMAAPADAESAETQLMLARARYRLGDDEHAASILRSLLDQKRLPAEVERSALCALFVVALDTAEEELLPALQPRLLASLQGHPELALDLARALHEGDRKLWALDLLLPHLKDTSVRAPGAADRALFAARIHAELGLFRKSERLLHTTLDSAGAAEAARRLAVIDLLRGDGAASVTERAAAPVETLTDACLAALRADFASARRWAQAGYAADPSDVPTALLLALLDPTAPVAPGIRSAGTLNPVATVELLAFLSTDGFAEQALLRADQMAALHADQPICQWLRAEALSAMGRHQEALELFAGLSPDSGLPHTAASLRETRALGHPTRYRARTLGVDFERSDRDARLDRLDQLYRDLPQGRQELARIWNESPQLCGASSSEVQILRGWGLGEEALKLALSLTGLRGDGPADEALDMALFSQARLLADDEDNRPLLDRIESLARRRLKEPGPVGPAVQFLLGRPTATPAGRRDPERVAEATRWIETHLQRFAEGYDRDDLLLAGSIEQLARLQDRERGLEAVDEVLSRDPSLQSAWLLRANWLAETGEADRGLLGLSTLEQLARVPELSLTTAVLVGRIGATDPRPTLTKVREMSDSWRQTPLGRMAEGLLALRAAEYGTAADLLGDSKQDRDGTAAFYGAYAALAAGDRERARRALLVLRDSYPASSLSVNLGMFLSQLSQGASASPSPTNR